MKKRLIFCVVAAAMLGLSMNTAATVITFDDITLGNGAGFSYSQSGFTLAVSASGGGQLAKIDSGPFTGLHIPGFVNVSFGTYTFGFSTAIDSIEVEFDALSALGGSPPETIGNFGISSGSFVLNYTNQADTSFDGSTITALVSDGQGIIDVSGAAFTSFNFDHAQNEANNGFIIERITVNTIDIAAAVPEPSTWLLLATGLVGLLGYDWRKRPTA